MVMLTDPICCWDQSGMPVLLIDRKRDGGAVIIRSGDVIRLSGEDVSGLRYSRPAHLDAPPRKNTRRRDNDGQASLRRTLRHSPNMLHATAAGLGLPASVADELWQELMKGSGEAPPRPVPSHPRHGEGKAKAPASAEQLKTPVVPPVDPPPASRGQQRSAALRSEAMRNADLRRRLAEVRLRDLSASRCPRVRDGYAWFTRQQQVAAQAKTHCVTEMTVATL